MGVKIINSLNWKIDYVMSVSCVKKLIQNIMLSPEEYKLLSGVTDTYYGVARQTMSWVKIYIYLCSGTKWAV